MKSASEKFSSEKKTFTSKQKEEILDKLVTARIGLLIKQPFFGNLATRLALVPADDFCDTLATDGRRIYYSNEFVSKLSIKETEFGIAHEVLHCVLDHISRRGDRDPQLSNIAADYVVNQILKDEGIGEVPSFIKIFQDNRYRGKPYEEVYKELYDNAEKIDIGSLGNLLDDHDMFDQNSGGSDGDEDGQGKKPVLSKEERKAIRDEIVEAVLAASHGAGNIPEAIRRIIKDITEPKMNWRQILRQEIHSLLKTNFSWTRPNRKSQQTGAVLPGMVYQDTIDVAVAIDLSGSISSRQVKDFLAEVKGIMEDFSDFNLKLWCFDTNVYSYKEFTEDNADEIMEYEFVGGGGTDFMCNWTYMEENDICPKKFIMFTDGLPWASWGDPNYCETLFVIHGSETIVAPFGETLYYKEQATV